MKKLDKTGQNGPFYQLDRRRQKAIKLLFEDELTDEQIAKAVQRRRSTLDNWKNDELFKAAQQQYNHLVVKKEFESKALRKLVKLLDAKSEMVQLQSANSILKLSGMLSDNSTPELDKARIRKANADADIVEQKAKMLKNDKAGITKIVFTDDLKPDKEDDINQKGDESNRKDT
ncbi:helix-turn-helix domain-containing protein [Lactobacillus reuteri]|uniref:phBC6A51 family helix-turn-helix protein n=1 Tax=Limosilactobacillus reuteri TaxID=1598 RepID=UPI00128E62C8|nr:phBC6A51 family helix-turn-helix protein [Limosilactobacillus reuteri]MQB72815.1 helix-turn-helix domain-containing protein [Limosilactobacillus reuteri]